jgi:uncharacterized protein
MNVKPSANEEEYFARQEVERRRQMERERQATERESQRTLHFMRCPKCGMKLAEVTVGDVRIDKCFSCEGLWLDRGELETLRAKESSFVARFLGIVRGHHSRSPELKPN